MKPEIDSIDVALLLGLACALVAGAMCIYWVGRSLSVAGAVLPLALITVPLHFCAGLTVLSIQGIEGSDAAHYHEVALSTAHYLQSNASAPNLIPGKEGWVWMLAVCYALVAPSPFLGVAINAVAMGAVVLLVAATAERLWSDSRAASAAAWLTALAPGYWYWGSIPLREACVALSVATVGFAVSASRPKWVLAASGLVALLWLRGSAAVLVGSALAIALFVTNSGGAETRGQGRIARILLGGVAGLVGLLAMSEVQREVSLDRMATVRSSQSSEATSAFDATGAEAGIVEALMSGLPRVVLGPYPWELPALLPLVPFALFWFMVVFLVGHAWRNRHEARSPLTVLLLPALALAVALSLYSGNYGTMVRLRDQILPLLIPVAAYFWSGTRLGRAPRDASGRRIASRGDAK